MNQPVQTTELDDGFKSLEDCRKHKNPKSCLLQRAVTAFLVSDSHQKLEELDPELSDVLENHA